MPWITAVTSAADGPLPVTSPRAKPKASPDKIEIVEEVAANHPARHGGTHGAIELPLSTRRWQQRLLNLRRCAQFLINLGLLHRLAIEASVLDRRGRFRCQRLERHRSGRGESAALLAVEIQHANVGAGAGILRTLNIAHKSQRQTQHVSDAERHGLRVRLRQISFEQVGHDLQLTGGEDLLRNLPTGLEVGRLDETAARVARHAHLERSPLVGQHDEPALGACRLDRGVENDGEHFVEYTLGPHRPERGEQRRHLSELTDRADPAVFTRPALVDEEDRATLRRCVRTRSRSRCESGCSITRALLT